MGVKAREWEEKIEPSREKGKNTKNYDKIAFGQNCVNHRFYQKKAVPFFGEMSHGIFIALI